MCLNLLFVIVSFASHLLRLQKYYFFLTYASVREFFLQKNMFLYGEICILKKTLPC